MKHPVEIPIDPHTLTAALANVPDDDPAVEDEPLEIEHRPGWLPAGPTLMRVSVVIHGRPQPTFIRVISSARPASLDRFR